MGWGSFPSAPQSSCSSLGLCFQAWHPWWLAVLSRLVSWGRTLHAFALYEDKDARRTWCHSLLLSSAFGYNHPLELTREGAKTSWRHSFYTQRITFFGGFFTWAKDKAAYGWLYTKDVDTDLQLQRASSSCQRTSRRRFPATAFAVLFSSLPSYCFDDKTIAIRKPDFVSSDYTILRKSRYYSKLFRKSATTKVLPPMKMRSSSEALDLAVW